MRRGRALGAALLAALLAACETPAPEEQALSASLNPPAVDESAPAAETPAEEAETAPEPEPEIAALPPEPEIDDDPARLIGLTRERLDALLGEPALVRREPPAEIRQYRGDDCVFDIFLYEEQGEHRVTYVEARDEEAGKVEARPCLNRLLRARLGLPLG
jgi:hypothetical protein